MEVWQIFQNKVASNKQLRNDVAFLLSKIVDNCVRYNRSVSSQVTIGGLLTEPGEATLVDILFAYDGQNRNSEWEIVTVNYSNILSTPCQQSDYEDWSPYNARVGRDCLLGRLECPVLTLDGLGAFLFIVINPNFMASPPKMASTGNDATHSRATDVINLKPTNDMGFILFIA